jgi:hypothetical protein
MSLGRFDVGDQIQLQVTFRDVNRIATDPTTVTFRLLLPSAAEDIYTDADVEVSHPETGVYVLTYDITADEPGTWYARCRGTGALVSAVESSFEVKESAFPVP